jgi:hypothetical protein
MEPKEQAQQGLVFLKEAILGILAQNPKGLRNSEIAEILDIHTDYDGRQKDYLSWSLLGLLKKERKVVRKGDYYFVGCKGNR